MGATTTIPIIVSADDVLHPENLAWIQNFGAYEGVAPMINIMQDHK